MNTGYELLVQYPEPRIPNPVPWINMVKDYKDLQVWQK